MIALRDYRDPVLIGTGADSVVFRAWREDNGQPSVLKISRLAHPPAGVVARFEKEHQLLASLQMAGVVGTGGLFEADGQLILVVEDFGGVDLARFLERGRVDLGEALHYAVQMAAALAGLHAEGILHKDVNPANVLVNERTGEVKLADLGLATRLPREAAALSRERALHGTVRYIAPEQTGRMNRAVDARSDLYSLGATLYTLFTGQPPFQFTDRAALVHAHIALPAPPPESVDPSLPRPVCHIVAKLLAKDPDHRYQAAATLLRDLRTCLDAVERGQAIADFPLAVNDVDDRFRLSQTVVGREPALATLDRIAAALDEPRARALWVTGAPGIGKSAVVGELERRVAATPASFAQGKFDEYQRGVPYHGLLAALTAEVRSLLRADRAQVEAFAERMAAAVGENGSLILDVLPALRPILGKQPPAPPLPGGEARERFVHTFLRAIQVFARPERPLVLFLDDLQWADAASLELIGDLLTEPQTTSLCFVGAWRPGEVGEAHPLRRLQARLLEEGVGADEIYLGPLDLDGVNELVAGTLRLPPDDSLALSTVIARRTGGNPFFVGQLLEKLHRDAILHFDHQARRWAWDLDAAANASVVEDVGKLLASRLDTLPARTTAVLERAALLGHEFELDDLGAITEVAYPELIELLQPALAEGLIHAVEPPEYRVVTEEGRQVAVVIGGRWRFLHDRVQEAALIRLEAGPRARLHLGVARRLLATLERPEQDPELFTLLHHFDGGLGELTKDDDKERVARLYEAGAQRAVASVAFDAALRLSATGLELLGEEGWSRNPSLTRSLWWARAQAARGGGDIVLCKAAFAAVERHGKGMADLQPFYGLLADLHSSRSEVQEAFAVGLEALGRAGRTLKPKAGIPDILLGLARTKLAIGRRSPAQVAGLPDNSDPDVAVALELLMRTAPAALNCSPNHYPLIIFDMTRLQVRHGLARQGCFSFAGYAVLLCAFGDIDGGLAYADLALGLLDRFDEKTLKAVTLVSVYWNVAPWRQHLASCVAPMIQAAYAGLDHGDIQFMGTAAGFSEMLIFFTGAQLDDVVSNWETWSPYYDRHEHRIGLSFASIYRQITHNLQEPTDDPLVLAGPVWDEGQRIPDLKAQNRLLELYLVWTGKALLAWSWGNPAQAADFAERAIALEQAAPSFPCHMALHCTAAMGALAQWESLDAAGRKAASKRADQTLKALRKYEARAPMNLRWRRHLLEAERFRSQGASAEAMRAWEAGIAEAQAHGYRADAAAACLRLAEVLRAEGRERLARVFLADGWFLMRRWGAHARAEALRLDEPWLVAPGAEHRSDSLSTSTGTNIDTERVESLDATAVLKSSQAISGEIELGPLVARLLSVCCENVGAQRAALILEEGGELRVRGVQGMDPATTGALLEDLSSLPHDIIRLAWRSNQVLLLDDAATEGPFADVAAVQAAGLRSVLAVPLPLQGRVEGVVYLDNNLVPGAFTHERSRMVTVLAGQAAISVRNAQLYAAQVAQKEAFARFVPMDFLRSLEVEDVAEVGLGDGVEKDMAVLFTDLRNFTDLSEGLSPTDLMAFLNEHLGFLEPEIDRYHGFIDKFIGDAILALFDAGAEAAVLAGVAMHRAHGAFNAAREARGLPPVAMGLGIHAGPLTLGTIGGRGRLSCTVLGDTVNLASRVESLTKHYGVPMLITDETLRRLPDPARFRVRAVDRVAVKGRKGSVVLYEVVDAWPEPKASRRHATADALGLARKCYEARDFSGAIALLDGILAGDPEDLPARGLRQQARLLAETGAPEGWTGVNHMDHK